MKTRQESKAPGRWSELLLGGTIAGVGAPLLVKGVRRWLHLGRGGSPASVGWTAGLLGALVAGRLARRHPPHAALHAVPAPEPETPEAPAPVEASSDDPAGDEALLVDWRREARRRRLAALEAARAQAPVAASGHEVARPVERGPRRGPSGREQPWHEVLEAAPA